MVWVYQVQPILYTNDLMGIVDGNELCPPKFISSPTKDILDKLIFGFVL
jgi:hypothetical protein